MRYMTAALCLSIGMLTAANAPTKPVSPAEQQKQLIEEAAHANTAFALDLYGFLKQTQQNLCFSPYSISSAFAMVYNGANGNTLNDIAIVFHWNQDPQTLDSAFEYLNRRLASKTSSASEDLRLFLANSLWIQTTQHILPGFLETATKYFNAGLRRVDFARQPETSRAEINSWVREHTQGKVADLVPVKGVTSSTRAVLVSCIYFKGKWAHPFDSAMTRSAPFYAPDNNTMNVPMMMMTESLPYLQEHDFAMLLLPYAHPQSLETDLVFAIFLPHEEQGIQNVERLITPGTLGDWINTAKLQRVSAVIPKFKITETIKLNDTLKEMGMSQAFGPEADFSGITGDKTLKIDDVFHKAFVSIDENGTEAAAATAINMGLKSAYHPEPPVAFHADHPFMFAIYDRSTNELLFLGRLMQPQI